MGADEPSKKVTEDGITILKHKHSLIKSYFLNSSLIVNNMGYRCVKTVIPGKEIEKKSNFYVFNIEGFFDLENGFYYNLQDLLKVIIILEKSKFNIRSYEELKNVLRAGEVLNYLICYTHTDEFKAKFNNIESKKKKKKKSEKKKTETLKHNKTYKVSTVKEKKFLEKSEIIFQELFQEFLYDNDNYKISIFFDLLRRLINILPPEIIDEGNRRFKNEINFLRKIIPYEDLKSLINEIFDLAENGLLIGFGVKNVIKGLKAFPINKFEGLFYLFEGIIGLIAGGVDMANQVKDISNLKKEIKMTRAQENFSNLINRLKNLIFDLKRNNYKELFYNNIIILSIDETYNNNPEPLDIQFDLIEGIENYAVPLNYNDIYRFSYIKNIMEFYNLLEEKLKIPDNFSEKNNLKNSEDNKKVNLEELEKKYFFMIYIKNIILTEYNDKYFWINASKSQMMNLIENSQNNFNTLLSNLGIKNINENTINNITESTQIKRIPKTFVPEAECYGNKHNFKPKYSSLRKKEKEYYNYNYDCNHGIINENSYNNNYPKQDLLQNQIKVNLIEKEDTSNVESDSKYRRYKDIKRFQDTSHISQTMNKTITKDKNKILYKSSISHNLKNDDINNNNNSVYKVDTFKRRKYNYRIARVSENNDDDPINYPAPPIYLDSKK